MKISAQIDRLIEELAAARSELARLAREVHGIARELATSAHEKRLRELAARRRADELTAEGAATARVAPSVDGESM